MPATVKTWWFEICYYTHYMGAWLTVAMAVYTKAHIITSHTLFFKWRTIWI